jgi:hypothetical protein
MPRAVAIALGPERSGELFAAQALTTAHGEEGEGGETPPLRHATGQRSVGSLEGSAAQKLQGEHVTAVDWRTRKRRQAADAGWLVYAPDRNAAMTPPVNEEGTYASQIIDWNSDASCADARDWSHAGGGAGA